jgi:hypothetical protein
MAKEEVKSVLFKNFTDEEFVCSWDGTPYRFPAGKEMYVEDWKAEHFAKHLVDRVMHKQGMITSNLHERTMLTAKALPTEEVLTAEEALDLNAREAIAEVKETVKKGKTSKKVVVEEEFSGLNEK